MPTYGAFALTHGQTLGSIDFGGFDMEILKLDWPGIKREAIECTNMNCLPTTASNGFGNKIFIPSAYVDPGELSLQVNYDATQIFPITDPSDSGPTDIVIKLGPSSGSQNTFNSIGFITAFEIDGPLDGKVVTANIKLKLTDSVDGSYDATGAVFNITTAS